MFADLIARLFEPPEAAAPMDTEDARVALGALMVRIARADALYDSGERAAILRALSTRYALCAADAEALLKDAEALEENAPDTVRFTRVLKTAVPYDDRLGLIESLWSIVLEDGERDPEEDAIMRQICPLLGVSDKDSGIARQRAAAGRG